MERRQAVTFPHPERMVECLKWLRNQGLRVFSFQANQNHVLFHFENGNPITFNSGPQTILAERMATHRQDHLHPTEKNTRVVPPDMSMVTRDDMPSASFELILTVCLNAIALLKTKKKRCSCFCHISIMWFQRISKGSSILNVNVMKCS